MAHSNLNRHHPGWTGPPKKVRLLDLAESMGFNEASPDEGSPPIFPGSGEWEIRRYRTYDRWWFLKDFLFKTLIPWGNDPIWHAYFFKWVETNHQLGSDFFSFEAGDFVFFALFLFGDILGILWYTEIIWIITWIGSNYMGLFHPCKYSLELFLFGDIMISYRFHGNSAWKPTNLGE